MVVIRSCNRCREGLPPKYVKCIVHLTSSDGIYFCEECYYEYKHRIHKAAKELCHSISVRGEKDGFKKRKHTFKRE